MSTRIDNSVSQNSSTRKSREPHVQPINALLRSINIHFDVVLLMLFML